MSNRVVRHEVGASLNANKEGLILAGGAVALVFYLYYKAKQTVKETAEAINPINPNNVVNTAVKNVVAAVTGQKAEDVSLAPNVSYTGSDTFTMTQKEKLAWLDNKIAETKTKLAAAKTTSEKKAHNNFLKELTARRADVAAGKP